MPGAGSKLLAIDAPSSTFDEDSADELSVTSTTFSTGTTTVGTTFVAPTSGTVIVFWSARMGNDTGGSNHRTLCSVKVSTGGTLDAGSVVSAPSDDSSLETPETASGGTIGQSRLNAGMWRLVSSLTPGSTYNVVVQQKVAAASTGQVFYRSVAVVPMP